MEKVESEAKKFSDLMRGHEVCDYFGGMNRVTLWRYVNDGKIPPPIKLSPRTARWIRSEIEAARQRMVDARRPAQAEGGA